MRTRLLLPIVLIIAMLLAGTAYALWSESLIIQGTINTGYLDTVFANVDTHDTEPTEKDVSSITATIGEDNKTITVTITNAYPCIDYVLEFDIVNQGTIPVHVMVSSEDLPECIDFTMVPDLFSGYIQIHPGNSQHVVLTIHLTNGCLEGETYTFSITLTAGQWNEYPPSPV